MGRGRGALRAYVTNTKEKLEKLLASDDPPTAEEEIQNIVKSVVLSVKRLCSAAPATVKSQIKEAVEAPGCLADPPTADLAGLRDAMEAIEGILPPAEPEEQEKADVTPGPEIESFAAVVARMWEEFEDKSRLVVGHDLKLSPQGRATDLHGLSDRCPHPLIVGLNEEKFHSRPLTAKFLALLDNYDRDTDAAEVVTAQEKREMDEFLDALSETPHFRYVHQVLVKWKCAPESMDRFIAEVYNAWFANYSLSGRGPKSSSGFEHVFVGEEKKDRNTGESSIIGFHNWIQFWAQERAGKVNYLGYVGHLDGDDSVVSVHFQWDDDDAEKEVKPVSTLLMGTSIAFELALGTLAFFGLQDGEVAPCQLGPHHVSVNVHKWRSRLGQQIRTVYLEAR